VCNSTEKVVNGTNYGDENSNGIFAVALEGQVERKPSSCGDFPKKNSSDALEMPESEKNVNRPQFPLEIETNYDKNESGFIS
jgi:hypothetical protein